MSTQFSRAPLIYSNAAGQLQEIPVDDTFDCPTVGYNVGIATAKILANKREVTDVLNLTMTENNYFHVGPVTVGAAGTIIVGSGVSYRVV